MDNGKWVCLQNCHLCISWMQTLEKICETISSDTVHPEFRLRLTSESSKKFPSIILKSGIKISIEPPRYIRANILSSYSNIDEKYWRDARKKRPSIRNFSLPFVSFIQLLERGTNSVHWNGIVYINSVILTFQ